jgi:DNA-binding NarL/FixJ family response regulator
MKTPVMQPVREQRHHEPTLVHPNDCDAVRTVEMPTARQLEILALAAEGMSYQQIADTLCISHRTVRKHVENTFACLGVHNNLQAVAVARRLGLLPDPSTEPQTVMEALRQLQHYVALALKLTDTTEGTP